MKNVPTVEIGSTTHSGHCSTGIVVTKIFLLIWGQKNEGQLENKITLFSGDKKFLHMEKKLQNSLADFLQA
jgi:hypothetical protein